MSFPGTGGHKNIEAKAMFSITEDERSCAIITFSMDEGLELNTNNVVKSPHCYTQEQLLRMAYLVAFWVQELGEPLKCHIFPSRCQTMTSPKPLDLVIILAPSTNNP